MRGGPSGQFYGLFNSNHPFMGPSSAEVFRYSGSGADQVINNSPPAELNLPCTTGNANQPPAIAVGSSSVTVDEGQTATNSGTVSDLDGDAVALSASVGAVTNNGDGTWSWSYDTTGAQIGVQIVTITANDGEGGTAVESFELNVNSAYNAPVVLTVDQDVWYASGGDSVVIVTGTFHDPEGVAPTGPFCGFSSYQCAYDPWSTTCDDANCSSGTWQMGIDLLETVQEVEIMFQDNVSLEFSSVWFTTIVVNSAPEIAAGSASVTVDEGQAATNGGTVSDADGDAVALSASLGTVTDNGDGTWSWSYDASDDMATQAVTISADDGNGGVAETSFDLTVNNVAPSVGEIGAPVDPQQVGASVSASASFSDPGAGRMLAAGLRVDVLAATGPALEAPGADAAPASLIAEDVLVLAVLGTEDEGTAAPLLADAPDAPLVVLAASRAQALAIAGAQADGHLSFAFAAVPP